MDKEKLVNLLYTISFQDVAIIMTVHSFLSYALLSKYLPITILLCPYSDIHSLKLTHKHLPTTTRDWHADLAVSLQIQTAVAEMPPCRGETYFGVI